MSIVLPEVAAVEMAWAVMFPSAAERSISPFAAVTVANVNVPEPSPPSVDPTVMSPEVCESTWVMATLLLFGSSRFSTTLASAPVVRASVSVPRSRSTEPFASVPMPAPAVRLTAPVVVMSAVASAAVASRISSAVAVSVTVPFVVVIDPILRSLVV